MFCFKVYKCYEKLDVIINKMLPKVRFNEKLEMSCTMPQRLNFDSYSTYSCLVKTKNMIAVIFHQFAVFFEQVIYIFVIKQTTNNYLGLLECISKYSTKNIKCDTFDKTLPNLEFLNSCDQSYFTL